MANEQEIRNEAVMRLVESDIHLQPDPMEALKQSLETISKTQRDPYEPWWIVPMAVAHVGEQLKTIGHPDASAVLAFAGSMFYEESFAYTRHWLAEMKTAIAARAQAAHPKPPQPRVPSPNWIPVPESVVYGPIWVEMPNGDLVPMQHVPGVGMVPMYTAARLRRN